MACLLYPVPQMLPETIDPNRQRLPAEAHRRGPKGPDGDIPEEPVRVDTQAFEIRAAAQSRIQVEEIQDRLLRAGDLDALAVGGHEYVAEKKLRLHRPEAEFGQSARESIGPAGGDGRQ